MGLICMGAPVDEYCSEAHATSIALPGNFDRVDFSKTCKQTIQDSFGKPVLGIDEVSDLLYDGVDAMKRFDRSGLYRSSKRISLYDVSTNVGDILLILDRIDYYDGKVRLNYFLHGQLFSEEFRVDDESRLRWFFEEV